MTRPGHWYTSSWDLGEVSQDLSNTILTVGSYPKMHFWDPEHASMPATPIFHQIDSPTIFTVAKFIEVSLVTPPTAKHLSKVQRALADTESWVPNEQINNILSLPALIIEQSPIEGLSFDQVFNSAGVITGGLFIASSEDPIVFAIRLAGGIILLTVTLRGTNKALDILGLIGSHWMRDRRQPSPSERGLPGSLRNRVEPSVGKEESKDK